MTMETTGKSEKAVNLKKRVMIVEDEGLFRDLLRVSLSSTSALEVVAAASDGESAINLARNVRPDVVITDIELGKGLNGIEVARAIQQFRPSTGIVLLSVHQEKEFLTGHGAAQDGGWSYLLKQSVGDLGALVRAVEGSAAGLVVLDPALARALRPRRDSKVGLLTPRQREVLELIAQGYSNAAIAAKLVIGEKAVENYLTAIYQHLNVTRDGTIHPRVKAVLQFMQDSTVAAISI